MQSEIIEAQIERRRERALAELFKIRRSGAREVLTRFEVVSGSGRQYDVQIRSIEERANGCSCPDFLSNLLGTCKHVEAVLQRLRKRHGKRLIRMAAKERDRARVYLSGRREHEVRVTPANGRTGQLDGLLSRFFDDEGILIGDPVERFDLLIDEIGRLRGPARRGLVVEEEIQTELERARERQALQQKRDWFAREMRAGRRTLDVISTRLYPYQEEGILHLAMNERALLADDMGLGKTVQAIAAATLLKELKGIQRVLVVCPASLKHQWEREIRRFTSLSAQVIRNAADRRDLIYATPSFFTIVNYELLLRERDIFRRLAPDLIVLDEAQRIKNWRTKTAQAVKELESRYAFVLSGTPLENNLDELYSVLQFLDPRILGPLWRFNQEYFLLERRNSGSYKVVGHKNLQRLRDRIAPVVLRRTRDQVIDDLPDRIDNNYFVEMSRGQREPYEDFQSMVARLAATAKRRPLTPKEQKRLLMGLQKMRVLSDALYLHDPRISKKETETTAPKLPELRKILTELVVEGGRKAILFSSFEKMLDLVADRVLKPMKIGHQKLAGSVPTGRRPKLLERFRSDDDCRVLLSTDAGGVGLNLQEASAVINLDLPWNPAVLEQRIGRAHRLGQKNSVQVINLVTRYGIEERMLDLLAEKRDIFASIFDGASDIDELHFEKNRSLIARLDQLLQLSSPESDGADASGGAVKSESLVQAAAEGTAAAGGDGGAPEVASAALGQNGSLRKLALLLADRMGKQLLLVREWSRPEATHSGLLVVIEGETAPATDRIANELRELCQDAEPPPVHVFDRPGYASLIGLLGPALEQSAEEAWRSPSLPLVAAPAVEDGRRKRAETALNVADERIRLARLMAGNGFQSDAFSPLTEALDRTLEGLLRFHGADDSAGTDVASVEESLVAPGHVPRETGAQVAWVRSVTGAPELIEPALGAVEKLLTEARSQLG